jgi:acyl-CoA synthetase (AMP-forming)/AMP-acid ligase II
MFGHGFQDRVRVKRQPLFLRHDGLRPGDRVAIYWSNAIEVVQLMLGRFHAGLIAVPFNRVPEQVLVFESLPRGLTGKLDRGVLKTVGVLGEVARCTRPGRLQVGLSKPEVARLLAFL